jgi:surface antigen
MITLAIMAASTVAVAPPAHAAGDDYPNKAATDCSDMPVFGPSSWCVEENGQPGFQNGEQWSARGYDYRNCTDFVAWRAAQSGVNVSGLGDASTWDDRAASKGFTVTNVPAPNMVAQKETHVAWVTAVSADKTLVWIEDYNNANPVDGNYRGPRQVASSSYRYIDLGISPGSGGGSSLISDGSFISVSGKAEVFRVVGGAPIYISSWKDVGGPKSVSVISQAQFDGLRRYPADGSFISAQPGGQVFRFVGGAPIYISSWNDVGGPKATVAVSKWTVDRADGAYPANHIRRYPADGSFISAQPGGQVFTVVGGAPVYVSSWEAIGGPKVATAVSKWSVTQAGSSYPGDRLRFYPADGTTVRAGLNGPTYQVSGGIARPTATATASVVIDPAAIAKAGNPYPWDHLRAG